MSTKKTIKNEADVVTLCQNRIKGIETHVPSTGSVACAGQPYSQAQLSAVYQKCIDTRQALVALRHQEEVVLQARDTADAARKEVDPALVSWAVNTFGKGSQQAKDLGYVPRNPTPPTAAKKAEAQAKAKATRIARGEVGKKAKQAITGATATTPATPPEPPAAPPATPPATKA
ncbi:MAG TPA: hypothetical protein VIF09_11005 [Polyangiaceae bacterium]